MTALFIATHGSAQPAAVRQREVTNEEKAQGFSNATLLAKPKQSLSIGDLGDAEPREGVKVRRTFSAFGELRVLEPAAGETVAEAVNRLRATGRYEYVEPDYVMQARATPNDPSFLSGDQWALRNIGQAGGKAGADIRAEAGWDVQTNASNVVVAIIDSGIRPTHEDLAGNLWVNSRESGPFGANSRDDDGNGYIDDAHGINSTVATNTAGNGTPSDPIGHGTGVASVIGAVGNNGLGMAGVAWNVKLMSLRFLGASGLGFISDEIECIDYAIANGAHLINASFGGSSFSQALFDAFKRTRDAGIIVVCAAGNDSENNDFGTDYPSGYLLDNILAVANTTRTDTIATSSAFGSGMIELGAPGSSILLASHSGDREYRFASGTSFSAPMVTGALALLKAKFPNDTYRETINRLLRGVDPLAALAGKTSTGGRLNLAAALRTTTARPFNDDFAQRAVFSGETGKSRGGLRHATRESGEPVHAGTAGQGSLWWTWTAPRTGTVSFDTVGSNFDTLLSVYTGSSLAALTPVASNDNEGGLETSKVTFTATAGTAYQLVIDAKTAVGNGLAVLNANLFARNDAFEAAQRVSGRSWSAATDNRAATREPNEPRIRNNTGGSSVWFRWTAPATRRYHIATRSSDFNTMLGVFTGTSLSSLAEVSASLTAGDSNITMNSAGVTISATAGTTYHIVVDSEVSTTGTSATGDFRISCIDSEWEIFGFGDVGTVALGADGTIYVCDAYGYLYAFNPDGSRKWRHTLTGYGTFSAPAVSAEGVIYVGDDFGYLHAVNPDGNRKWRFQGQGAIHASPAIAPDGTVYIASADGRVHAVHGESGALKWSFRMGTSASTTYSSPTVGPDGTIYCAGADSRLYALTPDGAQKWSFATDFIFASPTIGSDGTIYFGTSAPTRRFFALKPDGTPRWEFIAGETVSSSAAIGGDGTLYFGCADNKLYAVGPNGGLRWTCDVGGQIRSSSPVLASDGSIYIGCLDGKIYCVESDGRLRRTYSTADEVRASPILHNGRLYIGSFDYRLYAIEVGQVAASTQWPMHRQNLRRSARVQTFALAIGVQPQPVSAEVGETITFSVGAVGTGPLTYQWFFNGQPIAGATGQSYRVDPVTHASRGQYSARVNDATGNATSTSATLTVTTPLLPPSVFTAPAPQTVLAGNSVTLSVGALGTQPFTFQWLRNGEPIAGATASSYVLATPKPSDSGNYSVVITNSVGRVTSSAANLTVNPVTRIANLSIRSQVGGSAGLLTVGLTIGGGTAAGDKPVLLRAVGPTLGAFGVDGTLADPRLAILSGANTIAQNDDWAGNTTVASTNTAVGAFGFASDASKDAALVHAAAPGGYTVQITGAGSSSGVALAEVYDTTSSDAFSTATPRLTNVSALTQVGTGGDILIAGFSIPGVAPKTVLIRGIGPTLGTFGVSGTLANPKLEIYQNGVAAVHAANDDWGSVTNATEVAAAAASVGAFALAADSRDAVLLITLPPGSYTAQISGVNNTTGTALVEVYEVR